MYDEEYLKGIYSVSHKEYKEPFNPFTAVKDFHIKYEAGVDEEFTENNINLRMDLMEEENVEVFQELFVSSLYPKSAAQIDKQNLTKELSDLIYVVIGSAVKWGLPLEEVFKRTHISNMTKGTEKREDGKILKGSDYIPPMFEDLFDEV